MTRRIANRRMDNAPIANAPTSTAPIAVAMIATPRKPRLCELGWSFIYPLIRYGRVCAGTSRPLHTQSVNAVRGAGQRYRRGAGVLPSHRRYSAAVDDVFRTSDQGGARRGEESDEICHFTRPG